MNSPKVKRNETLLARSAKLALRFTFCDKSFAEDGDLGTAKNKKERTDMNYRNGSVSKTKNEKRKFIDMNRKGFLKTAGTGSLALASLAAFLGFALATPPASAASSATYAYQVGNPGNPGDIDLESPNVAMAANGDTVTIVGDGTLSTHPKSVTGGGTYVLNDSAGNVTGSGTWTATALLSFNSYGSSPGGAPVEGGLALVAVHLSPDGGGPGVDAVLQIHCAQGNPPPRGQGQNTPGPTEGIRLAVNGGPNFNQEVSGQTVFVRLP